MQEVWEVIKPYALTIMASITSGTAIYAIARVIINRFLNRFTTKYDINKMADSVANKLVGKTINIDVTAIAEKRLREIEKKIDIKLETIDQKTESYKRLLARIGSAVSHFKALSEEDKKELLNEAISLDETCKAPIPAEVSTVMLEPIVIDKSNLEQKQNKKSRIRLE